VADDKEAFLSRWSRLKQEPPAEKTPESPAPVLPPVDQLTQESDFRGFMHPKVEDALRRVALKKLFSDPHFNAADPFEPFSGDWTGGEPIPEAMLASLEHMKTMLRKPPEPSDAAESQPEAPPQAEKPPSNEPGQQDA